MLWAIYCLCHEVAKVIVGTMLIWPLNMAAFKFAWWLSGIIMGVS